MMSGWTGRRLQIQTFDRICVEFDNVFYVCDVRSSSIKILSPLKETAQCLKAIGQPFEAFSVHKDGEKPKIKSMADAASNA